MFRALRDFFDQVNFRDVMETIMGWGIFSMPFWDHFVATASSGLHAIVLLTGAALGLNGFYRVFIKPHLKRHRRSTDEFEEPEDIPGKEE